MLLPSWLAVGENRMRQYWNCREDVLKTLGNPKCTCSVHCVCVFGGGGGWGIHVRYKFGQLERRKFKPPTDWAILYARRCEFDHQRKSPANFVVVCCGHTWRLRAIFANRRRIFSPISDMPDIRNSPSQKRVHLAIFADSWNHLVCRGL